MRFQKRVGSQFLIAGLGAALLFAVGTKAQGIASIEFADGQVVETMDQAQASTASVAPIEVQANSGDQQDDNGEAQSDRRLWIGTALVWIGAIGIYACGPARRFSREIQSLRKLYAPDGVGVDVKPSQGSANESQGLG